MNKALTLMRVLLKLHDSQMIRFVSYQPNNLRIESSDRKCKHVVQIIVWSTRLLAKIIRVDLGLVNQFSYQK